jgi:hypothetical protein
MAKFIPIGDSFLNPAHIVKITFPQQSPSQLQPQRATVLLSTGAEMMISEEDRDGLLHAITGFAD